MTPPLTPDLESLMELAGLSDCTVHPLRSALVSLYARLEAAESELRAAHEERDAARKQRPTASRLIADRDHARRLAVIWRDAAPSTSTKAPFPWETPLSTPQTQEGSEA